MVRYSSLIVILFLLLCSCSKTERALKEAETIMITDPQSAYSILAEIDTLSITESRKERRALLLAYLSTVYSTPINISSADLNRALTAFNGDCSNDEVKSLIIKSEIAKNQGNPVSCLELLKDAEFLASQLDDKLDLAFIYLYLSKIYTNGFNGIVSEHYANKSLKLFNELHHRKQSIDARMAIIGALSVKQDYKSMLDSMLSLKPDVLNYSTESYKRYFLDQLARTLNANGNRQEAINIWYNICNDSTSTANTLAHWAHSYLEMNKLDSAEILINKAIAIPHSYSDEYLCRNIQFSIWDALGRKSELPIIDSLRLQAAKIDYSERKIAETSLALNKKYESLTQSAWKEREDAKNRVCIFIAVSLILLVILLFAILYYRKLNKLLRVENENNLLRLKSLEIHLFEKDHQQNVVAEKIAALFKSRFNIIDHLASAYYECKETIGEQKRIFAETKSVIADFSSDSSMMQIEDVINTAHDQLMQHFDDDFPHISSSQRKLALFIFCGLSLQSISIFLCTDLRNIYVYKSRLKSTISKSTSPRKDRYLTYFS